MARRPGWAFSKALQVGIAVAIVAIAAVVIFVVLPAIERRRAANVETEVARQPLPSGFFKLTDLEWASLQFQRVGAIPFPTLTETDGTIVPADNTTTQVLSQYTGRVTKVFATVGDVVRKGAPLFAVEGTEYAQAANDLAAAIETLRAARVQLRVTAANRARLLQLQKIEGAATKDVEQSAADLATARTTVRNGESAVALVRSRLRVLGLDDAAIDRFAKARPRQTLATGIVVPAPITGVVMQRAVGVGQNLDSAANGSTDVLFSISDFSRVFFVGAVRETSISKVHLGDPISVRMLAFPERTFAGNVRYIAPTVDAPTHRVFVRAEVANPDGSLKPGMFGNFAITIGPPTGGVGVPEDAVIYEGDTARVWVAGPDKSLALRYVRTGKTVAGVVQVLGGLRPGDRVVTSGAVFIDRALRGDK